MVTAQEPRPGTAFPLTADPNLSTRRSLIISGTSQGTNKYCTAVDHSGCLAWLLQLALMQTCNCCNHKVILEKSGVVSLHTFGVRFCAGNCSSAALSTLLVRQD
jgi:hypothetical protein